MAVAIKKRNPALVIIFFFITFGLYGIYWIVKTKNEINGLGASIPTGWFIIIPIAHFYFMYKYMEGFAVNVKKDNNNILMWFFVCFFVPPLAVILVQQELNKLAA